MKAPRPQTIIQDHIFKITGDEVEIRSTVGAHFFTVFTWIAIVSKKKLYQEISPLGAAMAPDVVLLILCMKLVSDKPSNGFGSPRTRLYLVA